MGVSVVGVDLAAGRGVTAVATLALSLDGQETPGLTLRSLVHAHDDDAIIAEVERERPRAIALDAPLTLPAPVTDALVGRRPDPEASRYTRAAERDPIWSRLGVRPFPVSFLGGLTFRAVPLAARLREMAPSCAIIEVFPSGALAALGMRPPTGQRGQGIGQRRQSKVTADVRRVTQDALAGLIARIPVPQDGSPPLDADSLDAIAAALVASLFLRGYTLHVGDEQEGGIVMPAPDAATHLKGSV